MGGILYGDLSTILRQSYLNGINQPFMTLLQFRNMSVTSIQMYIGLELLKAAFSQLQQNTQSYLNQMRQILWDNFQQITSYLIHVIGQKQKIIAQHQAKIIILQSNHSLSNDIPIFQQLPQLTKVDLWKELKDYEQKYNQAKNVNEAYEKQFVDLCSQIKELRDNLDSIQNSRAMFEDIPSPSFYDYQPEEIEPYHEKGLKKMDSSVNLERRGVGDLDPIKEVTQISIVSDEESLPTIQNQSWQSEQYQQVEQQKLQSFECNSSIHDVNRLMFDGFSRETHEDIQRLDKEGISLLKNVENKPTKPDIGLPKLSSPWLPSMNNLTKIKPNYYRGQNGIIYTGNTVRVNQKYVAMGFGQLFNRNQLLYCGNWKNGLVSGWGKAIFSKENNIKQFQGEFVDGIPHGSGTMKFWNGRYFVGAFLHGQTQGLGVYYSEQKAIYEGHWSKGKLLD